jgi:hypothetical protein
MEVDLAIVVDAEDLVDHLRAGRVDLVANFWQGRQLRSSGLSSDFLAGLAMTQPA